MDNQCNYANCTKPKQRGRGRKYCGSHAWWWNKYKNFDNYEQRQAERQARTARRAAQGLAVGETVDAKGYVRYNNLYKHRLIMEQALGRALFNTETVHHKDGNRLNNNLENLELWSTSQPAGQRVIDKLVWARRILAEYENTPILR